MKISKVKITKLCPESKYIEFKGKNFFGTIWDDGSGRFAIKRGDYLFYTEEGFYKQQLRSLKKKIVETEKELAIMKAVLSEAETLDVDKIFGK